MPEGFVYMMTNKPYGTLYTGVTSHLSRRIYEHRNSLIDGFTKRYGLHMLVFYERHAEMSFAIQREKNIQAWKRDWKIKTISEFNPEWKDLYDGLV